jgi:hypothetical protein
MYRTRGLAYSAETLELLQTVFTTFTFYVIITGRSNASGATILLNGRKENQQQISVVYSITGQKADFWKKNIKKKFSATMSVRYGNTAGWQ